MDKEKDTTNIIHNDIHDNAGPIFSGVVYQPVFVQPGAQLTQNIINKNNTQDVTDSTDKEDVSPVNEPQKEELTEEKKKSIINDITSRFNFKTERLGKDRTGKRLTNERLGLLFAKIFGISSHPTNINISVINILWDLLTNRKKTNGKRDASDEFYWQTVLNIVGYFKEKKLIDGSQMELVKSIFPEADANVAKNIDRSIHNGYTFPDGTGKMIDWYIEELLNGNF